MSFSKKTISKILILLLVVTGYGITGCDVLDVNNPNNLVEDDLDNPVAAPAIANGAEATLTNALGEILGPYSTATDELTWIGTRDAWQQLDQGEVDDPLNEFVDVGFQYVGEARWTADEAIRRLEGFRSEGTLEDERPLVRSYFYGAVIYTTIADLFDNFALSDREAASPAIGEANMDELYDVAIDYLSKGLELSPDGSEEWQARLLALRARVHYSKALWSKLNPAVEDNDILVQSSAAAEDAKAALDMVGSGSDWRYQLQTTPETESNAMAYQVNERLELRVGDAYIQPTADNAKVDKVTLLDPVDEIPAPALASAIDEFVTANEYADFVVVSARELHLIIAEDALAGKDRPAFRNAINAIRHLDGLSDYTGQVPAEEMLEHSRRTNLFLQGRRLADLYRFGQASPEWLESRVSTGTFFPITITEIRSNPNINL
ncbi:hypothetical protein [Fodinibius sediminis]|uniref:SusD family protein n=1 Tax=Fodinibius sediminis TaxID=1214077 RepID=A0A521BZD2_9BACT|nr:hypothetical protein [Fodinibius sediminis]SMO52576.1 hypothetical protein SAMN06265218_104208 [Fodinibius sediminis]